MQNLRAYFIHYSIAIKWVMRAQEKIELSRMSQQSRLNFNQKLGMSLFSNKEKVKIKGFKNVPRGGKKLESCCLVMAVASPCHPMATDLWRGQRRGQENF